MSMTLKGVPRVGKPKMAVARPTEKTAKRPEKKAKPRREDVDSTWSGQA